MQLENFWSILFCDGFNIKKEEDRFKFVWHSQKKILNFMAQNWFLFLLVLLPSKLSTFESENINIWEKTLPYFTQMMIFSPNTSFWTRKGVIWWLFHDDLRARGKRNHRFLAYVPSKMFWPHCVMTMWCVFTGLTGLILWKQPYILLHCNSINSGVRMPRFSFHYYHNSGRQSDHLPL